MEGNFNMKALKVLGLFLVFILLTTVIAVCLFLWKPTLLVNKDTLQLANEKLFSDLQVDWQKINIDVNSVGLLKKNINLSGNDFCIHYEKNQICLKKLILVAEINLENFSLLKIYKLVVEDEKIRIHLPESDGKSSPLSIANLLQTINSVKDMISSYFPNVINIVLSNTEIMMPEALKIRANMDEERWKLDLKMHNLSLVMDSRFDRDKLLLDGPLNIKSKSLSVITDTALTLKTPIEVSSQVKIRQNLDKVYTHPDINFDLYAKLTKEDFSLKLKESEVNFKKYVQTIDIGACTFRLPLESKWIDSTCPNIGLQFSTKELGKVNIKNKRNEIFKISLSAKAQIRETLDLEKENVRLAYLWVEAKEFSHPLIKLSLQSEFELTTKGKGIGFIPQKLNWTLDVPNFQKLVTELRGSLLAIPAPLSTMEGRAQFSSDELIKEDASSYIIPFQGKLSLNGEHNKLDLTVNGKYAHQLNKSGKSHLDLNLKIDKLHIFLPPVDPIRGIPNFTKDERIQKNIEPYKKTKKDSGLSYNIKVTTSTAEAIRVYYYLFDPYMALNLNATLKEGQMSFKLSNGSHKFVIEYLRREVTVEHLHLSSGTDSEKLPLDIMLLYQTSDYDLYLNIVGTLDNPRVLLSSQPRLPREDIISLLLYNRKSDQITSFQKESVGGTDAALADRTLGLFSIWAFASTPIESVTYNPSTRLYSAQVALPGNVHLNIGTNWESVNNLSFRKRISDTWVLVTSYLPGETNTGKGNIMLQKEINY